MLFQNTHCYFFWKPPEIASTRGKQQSFLDILFESKDHKSADAIAQINIMEWSREQLSHDDQQLFLWCMADIGIDIVQDMQDQIDIVDILSQQFTHEQEYGLLNRLDTVTSGLLYMAKHPETYSHRKQRQAASKIQKYYLAKTQQPIQPQEIDTPLWHHTNGKSMIVADEALLSSRRKQKIKWWHLLPAHTEILKTLEDNAYNLIKITKWWRHQIRAHLAHIWHPILGEQLYTSDTDTDAKHLQLYSIGCRII